jgi:hypothetical protein
MLKNTEGQSNIDNPEKLATRRRKTKQNTQYILDIIIRRQTQIT